MRKYPAFFLGAIFLGLPFWLQWSANQIWFSMFAIGSETVLLLLPAICGWSDRNFRTIFLVSGAFFLGWILGNQGTSAFMMTLIGVGIFAFFFSFSWLAEQWVKEELR